MTKHSAYEENKWLSYCMSAKQISSGVYCAEWKLWSEFFFVVLISHKSSSFSLILCYYSINLRSPCTTVSLSLSFVSIYVYVTPPLTFIPADKSAVYQLPAFLCPLTVNTMALKDLCGSKSEARLRKKSWRIFVWAGLSGRKRRRFHADCILRLVLETKTGSSRSRRETEKKRKK